MIPDVHAISWNITRRCNLECDHCYMAACRGGAQADELSTDACLAILPAIARVNPRALLILTGGEPLLRADLPILTAAGRDFGFTVVVGTNGLRLREREARTLREHGVQGVSVSLDASDAARHDAFRHLPGAWNAAVRATQALRAEGLDFSIHTTIAAWNADDVPAMVHLARDLGARVLNVFFLVHAGRGAAVTDLTPDQYETVLTFLATRPPNPDVVVRAKCAPQSRRIAWQLDRSSPLVLNYADGACPAGKHYCRITPEGQVTPCPYMPVVAGDLRTRDFDEIWRESPVFGRLRGNGLGGRCGPCEFARVCSGCRARAYATTGDYMSEDAGCAYEPGSAGDIPVEVGAQQNFGVDVERELPWDDAARGRLDSIPSFARGMVVRAVEAYARSHGEATVTSALMAEVRRDWGGRFARRAAH